MADLSAVREWVGDSVDEDDIYAALDAYAGDTERAALYILRRIRATLIASAPAGGSEASKFTVFGDVAWDTSTEHVSRLAGLDRLIALLEARTGTSSLPTVGLSQIARPGTGR